MLGCRRDPLREARAVWTAASCAAALTPPRPCRYASLLMGISRGFGLVAGIVSSTATGFLISQVGLFADRRPQQTLLGAQGPAGGLCAPGLRSEGTSECGRPRTAPPEHAPGRPQGAGSRGKGEQSSEVRAATSEQ